MWPPVLNGDSFYIFHIEFALGELVVTRPDVIGIEELQPSRFVFDAVNGCAVWSFCLDNSLFSSKRGEEENASFSFGELLHGDNGCNCLFKGYRAFL